MKDLFGDYTDKCKACKEPIVWMKTKNGKSNPVNLETVGEHDIIFDHKKHTSHFATCKFADDFRKNKKNEP